MTVTAGDQLSPMPTPHSRRTRRHGLKVVLVTVVLLVGPFLALELYVRALIATDRLPTAPSHSEQLDIGLINVRDRAPQDVLIMGDSQAATGLEPVVLRTLLETELGRKVTGYNFAQPGNSTHVNTLLLDLIAREGRMPRVVIMDISMSSLVTPQQRPGGEDGAAPAPRRAERRPPLLTSALGRELAGCGIETELVDRIDCELAHLSAAWRWHGRPERIVYATLLGSQYQLKDIRGRLRDDGFFARVPARPEWIRQQIAGRNYGQDRVTPGFDQREADDFRSFAELVEAEGGTVIFVQVPLTKPYTEELIARNPDWEADRRAAAEQLKAAIGRDIIFVESYGDWWTDQSASDLNHLSAEAAKDFTRQLWDMPDFRAQLVRGLGGEVPDASPGPSGSPGPAASDVPSPTPTASTVPSASPTAG